MFTLRHDFVASLENLCQQSLMMLQAVDMLTRRGDLPGVKLPEEIRKVLTERAKELRAALSAED